MLKIWSHQLEALERARALSFEDRIARRLREHFDALSDAPDGEVRALVRLGVERAGEHDIRSDYDVALYIGAMAELGPDFDRDGRHP